MFMYSVPDYGRYCVIVWCLITGIFSLVGNLTLLVSSLVANALKLDKVSVILIQNLAATGLGYTVFIILPTVGSTAAQRWVYGEALCVVTTYALYVLGFMSTYLIASLNLSKLTVLLYPLRARLRSNKCGYIIAATLWAITIILIVIRNVVKRDITFSPLVFACTFDYRFKAPTLYEQATTYGNLIVPLGAILVTAVWLMLLVRRVRTLTRQGVFALLAVSIAYILSYLPFIIFAAVRKQPMTVENIRLYTVAAVTTFVSPLANPIIFYFTINSFKTYVDMKVRWAMGKKENTSIRRDHQEFSTRMSTLRQSISVSGVAAIRLQRI